MDEILNLIESVSEVFPSYSCLWNEYSLADDIPTERETSSVELLIGNDYYLDIILPQKAEVQS